MRWPFFACTSREIGNEPCAKRQVSTAIGGIASAAISASWALTTSSTIASADDHHHALDRLDDAPADEVAHGVDVVRRARDHLAGRVPVVEGARVGEVRVVEQLAQPRLDGDPDACGRIAAREVDPEPDGRDRQDRAEIREEAAAVRGR